MTSSSKESVLKIDGSKINKNIITTEIDKTPNILNCSKGTPLLPSNLNFGLLRPIKLQNIARIKIKIVMLRTMCPAEKFGHPSARMLVPQYRLSKNIIVTIPIQPSINTMVAVVLILSIFFVFNLWPL